MLGPGCKVACSPVGVSGCWLFFLVGQELLNKQFSTESAMYIQTVLCKFSKTSPASVLVQPKPLLESRLLLKILLPYCTYSVGFCLLPNIGFCLIILGNPLHGYIQYTLEYVCV